MTMPVPVQPKPLPVNPPAVVVPMRSAPMPTVHRSRIIECEERKGRGGHHKGVVLTALMQELTVTR
jgi:hypothetical protein